MDSHAHDVALIGTGSDPDDPDFSGFAMAYHHAEVYQRLENCELVACADIVPENAAAFAETFDIDEGHTYEDYQRLLTEAEPDVVSICVPPAIHADIVVDCARAGSVDAIHCEKPMDLTWGGAQRMAQICWRRDVQLTFNHQRRFKPSWAEARDLVDSGKIGDVERVELAPPNIYDWGTHAIDFVGFVTGDRPAEWVIGQIDYREEQQWFGAHNENQAFGLWEYDDGVQAVISTGVGGSFVPALFRFVGTEGTLDVDPDGESETIRWRQYGEDWEYRAIEEGEWTEPIGDAIEHVVDCLETGAEPELSARKALNTTEIIFGIWESARRRGRVDCPLEIDDNPLHAMVESGALVPEPEPESSSE
ncbi:Gfo/Idh/MocA family protein [Halomontanus rarus]|uniref:Gfo/Idh/MocA family protein n=1 Tax=Halomontanus rarus TaxID=3034020 RepID=UPI001F6120B8